MAYYHYRPQPVYYFNTPSPFNGNATVKFCVACARGTYCPVAASLVPVNYPPYQPQQFPPQSNQGWETPSCENESARCNNNISAGNNETTLSSETIMEHRDIQKFLAAALREHLDETFMMSENEARQRAEPSAEKTEDVKPTLQENGTRKRYSRFRPKTHICDICNKSFTLKQNVQTHMSFYHMSVDSELKIPGVGESDGTTDSKED